jgi:predicted Zn-dependent protease
MAAFYLYNYYTNTQVNPITGEQQHVGDFSAQDEIKLGLASAPQMIQQYGGLHPDKRAQETVDRIGNSLVRNSVAAQSDYNFDFHLLNDPKTINAFALPGGQVFITAALFSRLSSENQLAGVLGHEIGHVIHRHGAERMAKMELTQGLTGAAVIASGDYSTAQAAQMIGNLVNMKYGRDQELESDDWGVRLMLEANYDPNSLIEVMDILEQASGGSKAPEFQSTHPSPENRREQIRTAIKKYSNKL